MCGKNPLFSIVNVHVTVMTYLLHVLRFIVTSFILLSELFWQNASVKTLQSVSKWKIQLFQARFIQPNLSRVVLQFSNDDNIPRPSYFYDYYSQNFYQVTRLGQIKSRAGKENQPLSRASNAIFYFFSFSFVFFVRNETCFGVYVLLRLVTQVLLKNVLLLLVKVAKRRKI